jgi:hypothetical protein
MQRTLRVIAGLYLLILWTSAQRVAAQPPSFAKVPDQTQTLYQPYPLREQPFWFEVNGILNPVYITQFTGKYRLNGHALQISPGPQFYAVTPSQTPFKNFNETFDQSNSVYVSLYMTFLENSALTILHHIRLMIGVTHDKLETDSSTIQYKYENGGTELTVMLQKNISYRLSSFDYKTAGVIFSMNVQAGAFLSVAKVTTKMQWANNSIYSVDTNQRWQVPTPGHGWGALQAENIEVGGVLCHDYFINRDFTANTCIGKGLFWFFRRLAISVGAKFMVEYLHSADQVNASMVPGQVSRLTVNNWGVFFAGPTLNLKWFSLN